jgi:RNA polymerase sigma-70 factor (ECF subfamily)
VSDPDSQSEPHDQVATPETVGTLADRLFRQESARLRASLVGRLGTGRLDLADDIVQETLLAALHHWRFRGVPDNPAAWLTRVAQHKAVDAARRDRRHDEAAPALLAWAASREESNKNAGTRDDPIRLMLLCAHPLLAEQDRVILTLSLVAGFGTSEIARAFILSPSAAEQRLVRAKRTLRDSEASMELPEGDTFERLGSVLGTLYLMLNEGYSTHTEDEGTRRELIAESRRLLGMLLASPVVPEAVRPDVHALCSLGSFLWARVGTRVNPTGGLVLMEDQDRTRWDKAAIGEGFWHLARSCASERLTPHSVEAAIAGCHAAAPTFGATDWGQIVDLYHLLARMKPTPVVLLNAAAAVAMHLGPEAGLAALDAIPVAGLSERYHLVEATRGEILRRAGRREEAAKSFGRALMLPCSKPEREFLQGRLREVGAE